MRDTWAKVAGGKGRGALSVSTQARERHCGVLGRQPPEAFLRRREGLCASEKLKPAELPIPEGDRQPEGNAEPEPVPSRAQGVVDPAPL